MEFSKTIIADIKDIISNARKAAIRSIDHERVLMYWNVGKRIFEEEQSGQERASIWRSADQTSF